LRTINAFTSADFGDFIEIGLPATKLPTMRELDEKWAYLTYERLGIKKEEVIPTDVITMQLFTIMQAEDAAKQQQEQQVKQQGGQTSGGKPPVKSMGMGGGKGNLF
jgi:hypothetical protein